MIVRGTASLRAPAIALSLFVFLLYTFTPSNSAEFLRSFSKQLGRGTYQDRRDPPVLGCPAEQYSTDSWLTRRVRKEKAAVLLLARDTDLEQLLPTLDNFEQRFNAKFRYPYVFLNDVPYSSSFKAGVVARLPRGAEVEFGQIPHEHWSIPPWLDKKEMRERFKQMEEEGIQYAGRESYHHMCRYYSGLFALHPLLAGYNYYWRLEPGGRCIYPRADSCLHVQRTLNETARPPLGAAHPDSPFL